MDDLNKAYRLSIYVKGAHDDVPWLYYKRVFARRSTAMGVATRYKNASKYYYSKFDHATIESYELTGESEVIT